jgi:hypothetical protein
MGLNRSKAVTASVGSVPDEEFSVVLCRDRRRTQLVAFDGRIV